MTTTGKLYAYFPEADTVDCDGKIDLEDFFATDLAKLWQETTDCGASKAILKGQSFVMFVPDKMNQHVLNAGCRYFIIRCLNR